MFPKKMLCFPDCPTGIGGAPSLVAGAPRSVAGTHRPVTGTPALVTSAPRLVTRAPSLVTGGPECTQVHAMFSMALGGVPKRFTITPMVLMNQSSEIPVTPKADRNPLLGSDTLLQLTHPCLHFTSSQTLLQASRD